MFLLIITFKFSLPDIRFIIINDIPVPFQQVGYNFSDQVDEFFRPYFSYFLSSAEKLEISLFSYPLIFHLDLDKLKIYFFNLLLRLFFYNSNSFIEQILY